VSGKNSVNGRSNEKSNKSPLAAIRALLYQETIHKIRNISITLKLADL